MKPVPQEHLWQWSEFRRAYVCAYCGMKGRSALYFHGLRLREGTPPADLAPSDGSSRFCQTPEKVQAFQGKRLIWREAL